MKKRNRPARKSLIPRATLLDAGSLPVEGLLDLALREGRNPRSIYQAHRWFARRLGSAFRALLVSATLPEDGDFWEAYYEGVDLSGQLVLDGFVGGGTSAIEALRLNADVIGLDVDAVACAITSFETRMARVGDLGPALKELKSMVGAKVSSLYRTMTPDGEEREVLHYFWVQVVECSGCGEMVEAHPHYQLAYEAEGTHQWVFCPTCHEVQKLHRRRKNFVCGGCGTPAPVEAGTVNHGLLTCPHCHVEEQLIDVAARTNTPPCWKLFAVETIEPGEKCGRSVPLSRREFRRATDYDRKVFEKARRLLSERRGTGGKILWVPERAIPREGRVDSRPLSYGYRHYHELFNDRQLLHLSLLAEAISDLPQESREAFSISFSDHLTTNCMLTHYAFGWRRLAPLFSVRSFRHVTRPVEINPWMDGTGRGTFPNAVRQVERAVRWAKSPSEALRDGGFREMPPLPDIARRGGPKVKILQKNSRSLRFISDSSVSLALTDPPYFDNIAYSELSDFFLPWLQILGLLKSTGKARPNGLDENLAAGSRSLRAVIEFQESLGECFSEIARVLKPSGRLIFTYQHRAAIGWLGLAGALAAADLRLVQLFPMPGDGDKGLHTQDGSIKWDAVFVLKKGKSRKRRDTSGELQLSAEALRAADAHHRRWRRRLSRLKSRSFREPDSINFYCACLVAAAVGLFPHDSLPDRPLKDLLKGYIRARGGDNDTSCLASTKKPFPNTSAQSANVN